MQSYTNFNYTLSDFGKELMALLVPFMLYLILPRIYKKDFPKIQTIEKNIKTAIVQAL